MSSRSKARHVALEMSLSRAMAKRVLTVGAVLALCGSALSISALASASAKTSSCVSANGVKVTNTTVCKGIAFYKGQTLLWIAPTSAGSAYDIESRAFAKELALYFGATINIQNISTAGSVAGQDTLAASNPNGLTIGFYNLSSDFYDYVANQPNVDFNFKDVALLGGTASPPDMLATQASSPYTSFAALKQDSSAANPVKLGETSGSAATLAILTLKEFAIPSTYVTGYANTAALTTGFIRGDEALIGSGTAGVLAELEAGTIRDLAEMVDAVKLPTSTVDYSYLSKAPTVGALLEKYPPTTNGEKAAAKYLGIVASVPNFSAGAPSATPSYLVTTLRAAVKWAAHTAYVKSEVVAQGNPSVYTSPVLDKAELVKDLLSAPKMKAFLGYS